MARLVFLSALLIGAAAPVLAGPSPQAAVRNANNFDVILSQYPERARAAGEQGAVGFQVTVDRQGNASACQVTHTSGHPRLDSETCELILKRGSFRAVRNAEGRRGDTVHQGVINWRLDGKADAAPLVAVVAASKNLPEKKICRRRVRTGSLADVERRCATQADWDRMSQRTQAEWGALQGTHGNTNGN